MTTVVGFWQVFKVSDSDYITGHHLRVRYGSIWTQQTQQALQGLQNPGLKAPV
jgi:hypothetical protein